MAIRHGGDRRKHNRLVLALKKAMEATLDETTWKELGYATDAVDWINGHGRLLRSLHWGDPDYGSCVLDAVEYIVGRDPANMEVILDFPGIKEWLRQNEPSIYDEYCGGDVHPKTAQALARHSTITLTMDRYSHTLVEEQSAALGALPDLSRASRQVVRATGTEDANPGDKNLAFCLALQERFQGIGMDSDRQSGALAVQSQSPVETVVSAVNPGIGSVCTSGGGPGLQNQRAY